MNLQEEFTVKTFRVTGMTCDRCGKKCLYSNYDYTYPINFEYNPSEEDELILTADLCFDCSNELLPQFCDIITTLRELIPNASVRASTMLDWEPTGVYSDEA